MIQYFTLFQEGNQLLTLQVIYGDAYAKQPIFIFEQLTFHIETQDWPYLR